MNILNDQSHATKQRSPVLAFGLLVLSILNPVWAQKLPGNNATDKTVKTVSTASRLPDWNGAWVIADFFMDKLDSQASVATPPRASTMAKRMAEVGPPSLPKLKGIYKERNDVFRQKLAQGISAIDPTANCMPQGLTRFWGGPYAFEIMQTPKQINIFQEWNEQTHRIYLDGRPHPDDPDPSYNGHSIGKWENGVLVVDSVGFTAESLMEGGTEHSEEMRVTERIRQLGPDLIEVSQTIIDPQALEEPWTRITKLRRKPGMEVVEYVCAQNNRNMTSEDGKTGFEFQKK